MTLQKYLLGMAVSTIFCFIAFILVLVNIDPFDSGMLGVSAFYLSLGFTCIGVFTIVGFYLRVWLTKNEVLYAHVTPAFRQAVLLSFIIICSLLLKSIDLFNVINEVLLFLSIGMLEFFFMSKAHQ